MDCDGDCFTCEWIKAHGAYGESVENFALKTLSQNLAHRLYLGVSFHKLGTIIPNCNSYQSVNGMTGTTHRRENKSVSNALLTTHDPHDASMEVLTKGQ